MKIKTLSGEEKQISKEAIKAFDEDKPTQSKKQKKEFVENTNQIKPAEHKFDGIVVNPIDSDTFLPILLVHNGNTNISIKNNMITNVE